MLRRLVNKACQFVAERLPHRVIPRPDGRPYLVRYYVFGSPREDDGSGRKRGANLYLHRFLSSDVEPELHSHPWKRSVSLVLTGGYEEERRIGNYVVRRTVRPGMLNFIDADDFHRVDLLEDEAWTLFLAGEVIQSWGFWNRKTRRFYPWREHVMRRHIRAGEA